MNNILAIFCLITLVFLNFVVPARAMDENERYRVVGDFTCSQVLDKSKEAQVLTYVRGFATATNVWLSARKDHFKGMSVSDIVIWVSSHCHASPLSTLGSSLTKMVSELSSAD